MINWIRGRIAKRRVERRIRKLGKQCYVCQMLMQSLIDKLYKQHVDRDGNIVFQKTDECGKVSTWIFKQKRRTK